MSDKYVLVPKPKEDIANIKPNEIRVTSTGKMHNYIRFAESLFQEKQMDEVVIRAMGRTINKTITIAELLRRCVPGLHQITKLDSLEITDTYEPLEEGLDIVTIERHVSTIEIRLSTKEPDTSDIGYQPPIAPEKLPLNENVIVGIWDAPRGGRGGGMMRGRGRGAAVPRGRGRGAFSRGRGRRGGRGRGV